jgi:hypothetical protein
MTVEARLRELLAAGPRSAAAVGREGLGLSGPEEVVARVAEAALAKLGWAEREGALWRVREGGAPAEGVELVAVDGDRAARGRWRGGRLSEMKTSAVPAGAPGAVAWGALDGALSLRALCRVLDPTRAFTTPERAAADWRLPHRAGDDAEGALCLLGALFDAAAARAREQGIEGLDALRQAAGAPRPRLDLAPYRFDARFLAGLPETPGTYRFLDGAGDVFYVGKAVNLRNRVLSYFRVPRAPDGKWRAIVERLRTIEFTILGSELEALLEEHRLIGELREGLINVQTAAHERPARRLPERSVWVLPAAADDRAALWLHRRGAALKKEEVRLCPRGVKSVAARARRFFEAVRHSDPEELSIAEGWLGDNAERVARLDPDRADFERLLGDHLRRDAFAPVAYR